MCKHGSGTASRCSQCIGVVARKIPAPNAAELIAQYHKRASPFRKWNLPDPHKPKRCAICGECGHNRKTCIRGDE